jgi:hypothetical protein
MGIPVDDLMERMYTNMAKKEAHKQVTQLLDEDGGHT